MSRLNVALILALALCRGSAISVPAFPADFEQYLLDFNKVYSLLEKLQRLPIFKSNMEIINELNAAEDDKDTPAGEDKAVYGCNDFTDWSQEEFMEKMANMNGTMEQLFDEMEEWRAPRSLKAPAQFDWRQKNKVTPVKNQGSCGSCWSFATVANVEIANAIKNNKQAIYSEQQLLDCDRRSNGCGGGWPDTAIQSIIDYKGLMYGNKYPYENRQGRCRFNRGSVGVQVSRNMKLRGNDEQGMANFLSSTGSMINLINAKTLQYYKGGILNSSPQQCDNSRNAYNHALITVAYGQAQGQNGMPYWVLKNSWGTGWGENGYARIRRGANTCGLANYVNSVVLA